MPFILIFQLVFSGGIIPLPEWSRPLSNFTISNYGIRALASQSGYNELPMTSVWNSVSGMKNSTIGRDFTVAELMEKLDSPAIEKFKDRVVLGTITVGDAQEVLGVEKDEHSEETLTNPITVGQVVELLKNSKYLNEHKDKTISLKTTVGDVLDILGEENVKNFVQQKTAEAAHKDEYESSMQNIARNWLMLGVFIAVFAALATLMLELIDKDKR
jgi:SOS response regulatory protein OraA/RecX